MTGPSSAVSPAPLARAGTRWWRPRTRRGGGNRVADRRDQRGDHGRVPSLGRDGDIRQEVDRSTYANLEAILELFADPRLAVDRSAPTEALSLVADAAAARDRPAGPHPGLPDRSEHVLALVDAAADARDRAGAGTDRRARAVLRAALRPDRLPGRGGAAPLGRGARTLGRRGAGAPRGDRAAPARARAAVAGRRRARPRLRPRPRADRRDPVGPPARRRLSRRRRWRRWPRRSRPPRAATCR